VRDRNVVGVYDHNDPVRAMRAFEPHGGRPRPIHLP
jgi:hypothetical protein